MIFLSSSLSCFFIFQILLFCYNGYHCVSQLRLNSHYTLYKIIQGLIKMKYSCATIRTKTKTSNFYIAALKHFNANICYFLCQLIMCSFQNPCIFFLKCTPLGRNVCQTFFSFGLLKHQRNQEPQNPVVLDLSLPKS